MVFHLYPVAPCTTDHFQVICVDEATWDTAVGLDGGFADVVWVKVAGDPCPHELYDHTYLV